MSICAFILVHTDTHCTKLYILYIRKSSYDSFYSVSSFPTKTRPIFKGICGVGCRNEAPCREEHHLEAGWTQFKSKLGN